MSYIPVTTVYIPIEIYTVVKILRAHFLRVNEVISEYSDSALPINILSNQRHYLIEIFKGYPKTGGFYVAV